MAKFGRKYELTKKETEELLLDFSIVLSEIKKPREAVAFIKDILSASEARMLAKRLKIAELLLENLSYGKIARVLKVSSGTIARVNQWLQFSGDGYRILIERLQSKRKKRVDMEGDYRSNFMKRRYPMYYWPQILLETIIMKANQRQRAEINQALEKLDEKNELFERIDTLLKDKYKTH